MVLDSVAVVEDSVGVVKSWECEVSCSTGVVSGSVGVVKE